jgi:hypothetical protein
LAQNVTWPKKIDKNGTLLDNLPMAKPAANASKPQTIHVSDKVYAMIAEVIAAQKRFEAIFSPAGLRQLFPGVKCLKKT